MYSVSLAVRLRFMITSHGNLALIRFFIMSHSVTHFSPYNRLQSLPFSFFAAFVLPLFPLDDGMLFSQLLSLIVDANIDDRVYSLAVSKCFLQQFRKWDSISSSPSFEYGLDYYRNSGCMALSFETLRSYSLRNITSSIKTLFFYVW